VTQQVFLLSKQSKVSVELFAATGAQLLLFLTALSHSTPAILTKVWSDGKYLPSISV